MIKNSGDKVIVILFFSQKIGGRIKGWADLATQRRLGFRQALEEFTVFQAIGNNHDVDVAAGRVRAFGDRAKNKCVSNG